jgi:quinohemoprotein ethanol dehydrogenase
MMHSQSKRFPSALLALAFGTSLQLAHAQVSEKVEKATPDAEWRSHGGTWEEQRFSPLRTLHTDNVQRLGLAWYHQFDSHRGQSATPLVVDGVIYTTLAWSKVAALDAKTGKLLWEYDPKVPGASGLKGCCDVTNRGPAYSDGKLFVGAFDGRLIALDASNGKPLWITQTVDQDQAYTITGAPRVARGKVFIGNGGAEYGVRGYVSAYEADTGKLAWRFYTVPGNPAAGPDNAASDEIIENLAQKTWHGDQYWKFGGGGTVWDSIVYDNELDQLYIGVGNGSPWTHRDRSEGKGDNLFLSSIVALDPETGKYLWHYQQTPGETWDYTATQQMTLAELEVDGRNRKVLMQAPKNGFFYILDRSSGELLSAEKFAPVNWASHVDMETGRPVEAENARFEDGPFLATIGASGAHNWHPMSYSPETGLLYIPAQEVPFLYMEDKKFQFTPGVWNLGVDMMSAPQPETPEEIEAAKAALKGSLLAWDPVEHKAAWRVEHPGPWNGGTLATAGNLVFQGTAHGSFDAYDARSGERLWTFDPQTPILPGPISYAIDGEQYIAVMAGNGSGFPLTLPAFDGPRQFPPGRLLVFKLDGKASLPPFEEVVRQLVIPEKTWDETQVEEGAALYGVYCGQCHGVATLSAGVLPDLKRSPYLASPELWKEILLAGALESRGMANFAKFLNNDQVESLRAYVGSQSIKTAKKQ